MWKVPQFLAVQIILKYIRRRTITGLVSKMYMGKNGPIAVMPK